MRFTSLEVMADGSPCLEAFAVGEFEDPTAIFLDILYYRETLTASTYTLTCGGLTYSVALPEAATNKGMPEVLFNVQLDLRE